MRLKKKKKKRVYAAIMQYKQSNTHGIRALKGKVRKNMEEGLR